ncbi:unnamed protein product [Pseudo-nitzschia multistriata]|uniref:Uncharacterized protein n=1 Tax=Pseudo-nitzschia multistriata TaxID=183589 RepID=A0A448ZPK8_9STRA|nr:unnamed protein product [Pseudo-nitzschia multistriata]
MVSTAKGLISVFWVAAGLLSILAPLAYRSLKVRDFRAMQARYNWQEQAREYEEEQEQNNQEAGENNNYSYQNQWEQMRESGLYDLNDCKWYQLNCYSYYYSNGEDGEPEPRAGWYPNWYSGWSLTEEEREQRMEEGRTPGSLVFVYLWQMLVFSGILGYGVVVLNQKRPLSGLVVALGVFANMSFLSMWWLADGSIATESDYVQKVGFYGQFSVLMFMTNAWYVLFGVVFLAVFACVARRDTLREEKKAAGEQEEGAEEASRYQAPAAVEEPGWTTIN